MTPPADARCERPRPGRPERRAVVVAGVVLVALAGLAVRASDLSLAPDDRPSVAELDLGDAHVWSASGTSDEVALGFSARVLGWSGARIVDRRGGIADEPPIHAMITVVDRRGLVVDLYLDATDDHEGWTVQQVSAGLDPVSISEEVVLSWRADDPASLDAVAGTAYVRTAERGTVAVDLDAAAIAAREVSLAGHIDVGEPFCHDIQTTMLLLRDAGGAVTAATGGVWFGAKGSGCRTDR